MHFGIGPTSLQADCQGIATAGFFQVTPLSFISRLFFDANKIATELYTILQQEQVVALVQWYAIQSTYKILLEFGKAIKFTIVV